jgi:hypothetical protein
VPVIGPDERLRMHVALANAVSVPKCPPATQILPRSPWVVRVEALTSNMVRLGGAASGQLGQKNIRVLSVRYAGGVLGVHPKGSMRAFALDIDARLG